jgi:hypothetical protein
MTTNEKVESAGFVWRIIAGKRPIQPFSFKRPVNPVF